MKCSLIRSVCRTLIILLILLCQPIHTDITYQVWAKNGSLFAGEITLRATQNVVNVPDADAIVNAANQACLGGDGVDGAIHKAAGSLLATFNKTLPNSGTDKDPIRCPRGEARISPSFNLYQAAHPIKFVISTTRPHGSDADKEEVIAKSYASCLHIAGTWNIKLSLGIKNTDWEQNFDLLQKVISGLPPYSPLQEAIAYRQKLSKANLAINSILFPPISAGVYAYKLEESAPYVIRKVIKVMQNYAQTLHRLGEESNNKKQLLAEHNIRPFHVIFTFYVPPQPPKISVEQARKISENSLKIYQDILAKQKEVSLAPEQSVLNFQKQLNLIALLK